MHQVVAVTGGAGFIGSAYIRYLLQNTDVVVVNIDKLTYAASLDGLPEAGSSDRYYFEQVDVCDRAELRRIFSVFRPDAVVHLAAESHVDRSIDGAAEFVQTNLVGTYSLLEEAREHWGGLANCGRLRFRFHHVSTDEVFGSLSGFGYFTENSCYRPNSPYAATKAGSDHLVRAWSATYGMPVLITNCSNNFGPFQFPEKLIPLVTLAALEGRPLPVYGDGQHVRDWLYVEDHCRALHQVLVSGQVGETYIIGGGNERTNLAVVEQICAILDELEPRPDRKSYTSQITFVPDRPGHDRRYAVDSSKVSAELGWTPSETFETGIRKTVKWYLDNPDWITRIKASRYQGQRLGVIA